MDRTPRPSPPAPRCPASRIARLAVIVLLLACGPEETRPGVAPAAGAAVPLNLIVIVVDTLRADHLGYHGYERDTSPNLDALAAESSVFLRHRSQASRTGPSVATLVTGLHPRSHGVVNPLTKIDAKGTLDESQLTLAEILRQHGYHAAGFGANLNILPRFGFAQGYHTYSIIGWKEAAAVNRLAFRWLDGYRARFGEKPLFLYLHYLDPHSPYLAPPEYRERFADPGYSGAFTGEHLVIDEAITGERTVGPADREALRGLYDAEIRYVDDQVAELLAHLDGLGLLERSLVVFLSDHGEELGEHGSWLHGYTLYEEQLRVPLLIRHPDLPPRRIDASSRQMDILPTILELLDVETPAHVQGASLVPLMQGAVEDDDARPTFAETRIRAAKTVKLSAYSRGPWKYIETVVPDAKEELFHLGDDPGEKFDRAAAEPEETARMRRELEALRASLPPARVDAVDLSEDEKAQLRAMGYLPREIAPGADTAP